MSEVVKPIEVSPSRKIKVDLKESKPKESTLSKDKMHGKPTWVCHFCGKSRHIRPNCYKLQAIGAGNHPNVNTNSNARGASKKFWMQKT